MGQQSEAPRFLAPIMASANTVWRPLPGPAQTPQQDKKYSSCSITVTWLQPLGKPASLLMTAAPNPNQQAPHRAATKWSTAMTILSSCMCMPCKRAAKSIRTARSPALSASPRSSDSVLLAHAHHSIDAEYSPQLVLVIVRRCCFRSSSANDSATHASQQAPPWSCHTSWPEHEAAMASPMSMPCQENR